MVKFESVYAAKRHADMVRWTKLYVVVCAVFRISSKVDTPGFCVVVKMDSNDVSRRDFE
jgi:hypothetical protein